jgi:pyruvate/2-oxoglutarate/acetoin dehydrogenase E1 component
VIDLRTLRPLDTATVLQSLKKTNRMVVVEEGWPTCSIASEIVAVAMEQGFDDLDAPVLRVDQRRTCRCPMPPTSKSARWLSPTRRVHTFRPYRPVRARRAHGGHPRA